MDNGEQQLCHTDSKFRYYCTLMERALKSFENTREWADLISALAKVNKVVASHKSYTILPKKVTIGKRLAQCLHPALPAGVHIKALELYETIFNTIGPAFIAKDFPIYSAGLLPLLGLAAMTVKPVLLKLYETHVLPVCASIKPAAAGVILGVLPGLEEGSEYYERTNELLEKFAEAFGVEHFFSNFWSCLHSSSNVRLAGTSFLLSHIDRSRSMEDQLYLLGSDLGLLVTALKSCLEDNAVLVQRNTLDIMSIAFPFHDSQLTRSDQSDVISSAILVLLRRDMSLNRRLYAWLLGVTTAGTSIVKRASSPDMGRQRHDSGSSSASEPELEYFNTHSKRALVQSLQYLLDSVTDDSVDVIKPLRVVTSLLDRPEIGSAVLEDILINIFRLLRRFYSTHTEKPFAENSLMCTYTLAETLTMNLHALYVYRSSTYELPPKLHTELLKASNLLFGSLETHFIWEFLSDIYERVLWPSEVRPVTDLSMSEYCDMVNMLLSIMSLETYVETQTVHIPRLLYNLLNMLKENLTNTSLSDIAQVLLLCRRLTSYVTPADVTSADEGGTEAISLHDCIPFVQEILCLGILPSEGVVYTETDLTARRHSLLSCCLLLIEMSSFPVYSVEELSKSTASNATGGATDVPNWIAALLVNSTTSTADKRIQFISAAVLIDLIRLSNLSLETSKRPRPVYRYASLDSESASPVTVTIRPLISQLLITNIMSRVEDIFVHIWSSIDVERLMYCTECSFLMSNLLDIHSENSSISKSDRDLLQNVIIKDLTRKDHVRRLEAYKKFALFWHQTRHIQSSSHQIHHVLMVVLSSLMYETELVQEVIRDWLIHAVECDDLNRILEPYLILLLESDTSRTSVQQQKDSCETYTMVDDEYSRRKPFTSKRQQKVHHTEPAATKPKGPHSLVTREGRLTSSHSHQESSGSECSALHCNGETILNPFGTASDLDHLIFDGFTPHESLKNRWASMNNDHSGSEPNVEAEAKETNEDEAKETNEDEGASVDVNVSLQHPSEESSHPVSTQSDAKVNGHEPSAAIIPLPDSGQPNREREEPPSFNPFLDGDEIAEDRVASSLSVSRTSPSETTQVSGDVVGAVSGDVVGAVSGDVVGAVSGDVVGAVSEQQVVDTSSVVSSVTSAASSAFGDGIDQQEDATGDNDKSHGFVLLYDQCYDTERVLFALSVIQKVIAVSPSLVLSNLTTSPCSDTQLLNLLARQRRSLEGGNYYLESSQEEIISLKNTRHLEVLVTICLYFWRSYHVQKHAADNCISRNSHVQLRALNLLMTLLTDVTHILSDSPKGFPHYMVDVLNRCKVIKTCVFHLQCLLDNRESKLSTVGASHDVSVDIQMFRKCLQLTECLVRLESKLLIVHEHQNSTVKGGAPVLFKRMMFSHPSLLTTLKTHLTQPKHAAVHHQWVSLITNSLPHVLTQSVTADVVQNVVVRICEIFDRVSGEQNTTENRYSYPPDYVQQLLEDFTVICHFCFMDLNSTVIGQSEDSKPSGISTGQILSNLVNVFLPLSSAIKNRLGTSEQDGTAGVVDGDLRLKCRDRLLSMMPKILSSVSTLWRAAQLAGNQKVVQLVIGFFSPILHNYTEQLLGSVAVVWSDSQDGTQSTTAHSTQSTLVELLLCIKALPMDTIVQKLSAVMKKPPNTNHQTNARGLYSQLELLHSNCTPAERAQVVLQLSCLKFLKGYIIKTPSIPKSSLSSVCLLLKHCLQLGLPAPGILLLLETVTEFVYKLGLIDDRKVVKDLQDIVGKVLEAFCQIISVQLEASSWTIRKNYTVKVRASSADTSDLYSSPTDQMSNTTPGITVEDNVSTEEHESEYTSHALALLAEVTAGLLDVVFPSEDKDKVASLLTNILSRIFPYLRNHNLLNMTCFQASSKLLASISSYQYTRRTWKRDVYDILLSPDFFKMDVQSLQFWKILADNLITHEKTMFKDLLAKFTLTANTIQLFSTKDYDQVQCIHNLKKLSFIIYSGDVDHYKHYMPDIQERLAENLRLTHAPAVLSQGFLCFRVLLLRMSSDALTSLWPTIITELVYVMTQIEQDLSLAEEDEHQMSRVYEVDSFSSLNEVNIHHSPSWLQLYLSASKMLDLLMYLPADIIPEFQSYIWMFTGCDDVSVSSSNQQESGERIRTGFSSHIPKIAQMMNWKFGPYNCSSKRRPSLLLQEQTIATLNDLHPFFARLMVNPSNSLERVNVRKQAELVIDNDFIEPVT